MELFKSRLIACLIPATLAATLSLSACAGSRESGAIRNGSPAETATTPATGLATATLRMSAGLDDEQEIRALIARYGAAANTRDLESVMRTYAETDAVLVYDVSNAPFRGFAEVTRDWEQFMTAMRAINLEFRDIEVTVDEHGEFAYTTFIERASLTPKRGAPLVNDNLRTTQIYKKINGHWLIVHEHKSKSLSD